MEQGLSCGRFLVLIKGAETPRVPSIFRREYRAQAESGRPDAVLRLEEGLETGLEAFPEGWRLLRRGGLAEAFCFREGRPAFSLVYGAAPGEVTVRAGKLSGASLRIGIQYGMMLALHRQCVGLHGVTLLCGDEIVILSAPSGTGKTTLAHLLEACGAIVINGDFALLAPTADGVIFEPTPFCGSSGRCLNHRVRVNRVVFLSQAQTNEWRELTGREALTRFLSNAFVPGWDAEMELAIQENVIRCLSSLKVNAYAFAPEKDAAETFFSHLCNYEELLHKNITGGAKHGRI